MGLANDIECVEKAIDLLDASGHDEVAEGLMSVLELLKYTQKYAEREEEED